ncbi:hypothetical protein TIFTF001_022901 [Ficus carica]|uniref:Uncharacterized protein n=1 Tax=Ficus carica TaxID=3494 RepID=A0AA88DFV7_FICCA|nr:hypothetical protein TIFTF001_022901 [Ficus carica]
MGPPKIFKTSPFVVQRIGSRRNSSLLVVEVAGAAKRGGGTTDRPRSENLMAWAGVARNRLCPNGVNISWSMKGEKEKNLTVEVPHRVRGIFVMKKPKVH